MLRFKKFVTENTINDLIELPYMLKEGKNNLHGSIGSERAGIGHITSYILPYLSAEQKKHVGQNFIQHERPEKFDDGSDGELYNSDPSVPTHELASKVGVYGSGTPVRVIGVRHDHKGQIIVQTANHGEFPASKLKKPEALKKPVMTKAGFDLEENIARNLRGKPAGSTKAAYDFSYGGPNNDEVKGKTYKLEGDEPVIKGESKVNEKARMGTSAIQFDPKTKKWDFTNDALREKFGSAVHPKSGLKLLDHLNTYHSDGIISKGFSVPAAPGTTQQYVRSSGVNCLHLHRKNKKMNAGTTYTVGDTDLKGKTKLGHLEYSDLDQLDGMLSIAKTTNGKSKVLHSPHVANYTSLATNSISNPEHHRDLNTQEHAEEFMNDVDNHLKTKYSQNAETEKPKQIEQPIQKQTAINAYFNTKGK